MDHGKLTDHNGKSVDFRNVILIMTTNAGAADMAKAAYGFTRTKREGDDQEAITKMFTPEFRNRLDSIITFAHLSQEIIKQVVEKFVLQLEAQLGDRNVTIELSDEASRWLIANGYDELMGARPMSRVIQEHIKKPLADEVLFGHLKKGGHVRVIVDKDEHGHDKIGFEYLEGPVTPKPEKLPKPKAKRRSPRPRHAQRRQRRQGWRRRRQALVGAEGAADQGLTRHHRNTLEPKAGLQAPGLRRLRWLHARPAAGGGCADAGAVGQVKGPPNVPIHVAPTTIRFHVGRLFWRGEIRVDVGVRAGAVRHLYRHRRAGARLRVHPLVDGGLDHAGVGGAGAGDPDFGARHRRHLIGTAIAVSLSSIRMFPMVVALLPLLRGKGGGKRTRTRDLLLPAHFTSISMWVESLRLLPGLPQERRLAFCNGLSVGYMATAVTAGFVGFYLAAGLPPLAAGALLFLTPVSFLCSTARNAHQLIDRLALALGLAIEPVVTHFHIGLDLMWTGVSAGTLAYAVHRFREAGR